MREFKERFYGEFQAIAATESEKIVSAAVEFVERGAKIVRF